MTGAEPRKRVTIQLLLLAAALLLGGLLVQHWRRPAPAPAESWGPPLARGDGARVALLRLRSAEGELVIERHGERYRIQQPVTDLGSVRVIRELFRALETLELRRQLEGRDLAPYGLDPPRAILELVTDSGARLEIRVGDVAPASGDVYATWSGLPGVVIIPRFLVSRFFRPDVRTWRETEILPPSAAGVDSVWAAWPGDEARLVREAADRWRFRAPPGLEADALACERTVASLWRYAFSSFFDDPREWESLGLAAPRARWVVFRGGGADTIAVGALLGDSALVVQLSGRPPGATRADLGDLLTRGRSWLELRTLLAGRAATVGTVLLVGEGGARIYARRAGGWWMGAAGAETVAALEGGVAPDTAAIPWSAPADAALDGDVRNLFEVRGEQFSAAEGGAVPGRAAPLRIHLWHGDGSHEWIRFQPRGGASARGDSAPAGSVPRVTGAAVGSRAPNTARRVASETLHRWLLRGSFAARDEAPDDGSAGAGGGVRAVDAPDQGP